MMNDYTSETSVKVSGTQKGIGNLVNSDHCLTLQKFIRYPCT